MSRGRKTKYKSDYCMLLREHMQSGFSYEAFAGKIGIAIETLYNWEKKQPDFLEAKKIAVNEARYTWERLGIAGMTGKIIGFNATVWIFNMKNRFGWRDKRDIEHSTPEGQALAQVVIQIPDNGRDKK